ncbi:MAG: SDR family oxidoreductase [Deferribacteraceae bacterium]|jgi:3-oxoacyl-[acyl-carrier protein] reductase|nr:SDR family oxidoreductase [Deferribacteraceae bacterium]
MNKPLDAKTALITGASYEVGAACALKLAQDGANIALAYDADKDQVEQLAAEIIREGVDVKLFELSIGESASCKGVVDAAIELFGGVDIFINAQTAFLSKPLLETTEQEIDYILQNNLTGTFYLCRALARYMMKKRWGRIINIIGFAAFLGAAGETVFSASLGGVAALTKTLARELGSRNITVNAVSLGLTDTKLIKRVDNLLIDDYLNCAIVKRLGAPSEAADIARCLALPTSEYITGQVVHVNGGLYI